MNKTKINAKIIADSVTPQGDRLTSLLITFPRILLSEINTHRMLSKNTSSSRAIPFNKMVETVENDPFIPIAWQKEHTGMQGTEYCTTDLKIKANEKIWLRLRDKVVQEAINLSCECNVTKQLCNRLLEPFMWTTMLITGSREGWDNFFELRCPSYKIDDIDNTRFKSWKDLISFIKDRDKVDNSVIESYEQFSVIEKLQKNKGQAEIHMMALVECIYDAMNESTPKQLESGQWHIPFEDKINGIISNNHLKRFNENSQIAGYINSIDTDDKIKISIAMSAHTSYTTVGNEPVKSYEKWIDLHDKLIAYDPPHSSPMEHCARAMNDYEYYSFQKGFLEGAGAGEELYPCEGTSGWCNNLKGFIPYRYFIDNKIEL